MIDPNERMKSALETIRREFDESFARLPSLEADADEELLAVVVGGDPYAFYLSQIAGVFADRKIVNLPSSSRELLGVASFRGGIAPIYDLRLLLRYPSGSTPRWIVQLKGTEPIGVAFDLVEAHLRVRKEQISMPQKDEPTQRGVHGVVRTDAVVRPLIHVASLVDAIAQRSRPNGAAKDR